MEGAGFLPEVGPRDSDRPHPGMVSCPPAAPYLFAVDHDGGDGV